MPEMLGPTVIAVDGPSAAGKTTVSIALASSLGLRYLESGRAYRLLAYQALKASVSLADTPALIDLCDDEFIRNYGVLVSGQTPEHLRAPAVGRAVTAVAKIGEVRSKITECTREWAVRASPSIIEGRDIGTVVFPDAQAKFYLYASPEVRAHRRLQQEPGRTYPAVLEELLKRDAQDGSRKDSPLRAAKDAILIDTSDLTVAEVYGYMYAACAGCLD